MATLPALLRKKNTIDDRWFKHEDVFLAFKRPILEKYEIANSPGKIKTLAGVMSYPSGCYILTGTRGEQYLLPVEKFRELKDDHYNGTCTPKKVLTSVRLADHTGGVITQYGELIYTENRDYVVKHGENDYEIVKADIFELTYKIYFAFA